MAPAPRRAVLKRGSLSRSGGPRSPMPANRTARLWPRRGSRAAMRELAKRGRRAWRRRYDKVRSVTSVCPYATPKCRSALVRAGRSRQSVCVFSRIVWSAGGRDRTCRADRDALTQSRRPRQSKLAGCERLRVVAAATLEQRWLRQQIAGWLLRAFPGDAWCRRTVRPRGWESPRGGSMRRVLASFHTGWTPLPLIALTAPVGSSRWSLVRPPAGTAGSGR